MLQINSYPHPQAVSKVRIIDSPSGLSAVAGPEAKDPPQRYQILRKGED
jgi:hypothetical protein